MSCAPSSYSLITIRNNKQNEVLLQNFSKWKALLLFVQQKVIIMLKTLSIQSTNFILFLFSFHILHRFLPSPSSLSLLSSSSLVVVVAASFLVFLCCFCLALNFHHRTCACSCSFFGTFKFFLSETKFMLNFFV